MKDANDVTRLVERAQQGDEEAFAQLYNQMSKSIYFNAYKYLGNENDAKDVLQEVMLDLFRNIGTIRNAGGLRLYLYRATYHRCLNLIRKGSDDLLGEDMDRLLDSQVEDSADFIPQEFAETRERREYIAQMVGELRPNYKAALLLFYYDELSVREISEVMSAPEHSVKVWLQRGRASLRRKLERDSVREGVLRAMSVPALTTILRENADTVFTAEISKVAWQGIAAQLGLSAATLATATGTASTAAGATGAAATGTVVGSKIVLGVLVAGAVVATSTVLITQPWRNEVPTAIVQQVEEPEREQSTPQEEAVIIPPGSTPQAAIPSETSGVDIEMSPSDSVRTNGSLAAGDPSEPETVEPHTDPPDSAEATTSAGSSGSGGGGGGGSTAVSGIAVVNDTLSYPKGTQLTPELLLNDAAVRTGYSLDQIEVVGLDEILTDTPNRYAVLLRIPSGLQCAVIVVIEA